MIYRIIQDSLLIDLNQPITIIHQPAPKIGIHRSRISLVRSKGIQTINLMDLLCKSPPRLLVPKQSFVSRMYRRLDQYRIMLSEVVSLLHRFFYCYLSSEGLTGTIQSSHVGITETPQPTPGATNRTGHQAELVNRSGNYIDIPSPRYSQVPRSDLRERAKAVLKELYPLKIGFLELVKEGIEPKLLMELYAEIGIEIPLSSLQNTKANGMETNHQGRGFSALDHMEPQPLSIGSSQITSAQQNRDKASKDPFPGGHIPESLGTTVHAIPRDSHNSIDQDRSFPKKITVPQNQLQGEPRTPIFNLTAAQSSTASPKTTASTGKLAKAPATTMLGKTTIAKSGEKALERKDYIARMLAAKAGRPIPALSTQNTTDNATNQPQENQSKSGSPKQVNTDDEECLLIGNLSYRATELDLKGFFSAFPM